MQKRRNLNFLELIFKGDKMTVYKLTINLDATLAVQSKNGSFNYFKPSIGVEITVDETDDLTVLNKKFGDMYEEVIGPNFKAVVNEFLINTDVDEEEVEELAVYEKKCHCVNENDDGSCHHQPLEVGKKSEYSDTDVKDITELDQAKIIYHQGPQTLINDTKVLPKEEWE